MPASTGATAGFLTRLRSFSLTTPGEVDGIDEAICPWQLDCFVATLLAMTFLEIFSTADLNKLPGLSKSSLDGFPGKGHYPAVAVDLVRQVELLYETIFIRCN